MTFTPSPSRVQSWALRSITCYQRLVEGRPSPCRFFPSCSAYAHEAFELHGARRGLLLTVRRLTRCRPFGPSGYDPVPDPAPIRSARETDSFGPRSSPIEPHHHTFEDC